MISKSWLIAESFTNNLTLNTFLREKIPLLFDTKENIEISNSKIRRLIFSGNVLVNGSICKNPSFVLKARASVLVKIEEEKFFYEKQPDDIDFELTSEDVLFEDDTIIVVNKPAFLPTEATIVEGRKSLHDCVVSYLWKKNPKLKNPPYVGILHRLDRETSGVILFTKSRAVNAAVFEMFNKHTAKKIYRAVCSPAKNATINFLPGQNFTVEKSLARVSSKSSRCRMGLVDLNRGGQAACTEFSIAKVEKNLYFVDAMPKTGRTHQIRLHLSYLNLPIVGDSLYGGKETFAGLPKRIMLHAWKLIFPHPVTKEILSIESPLPKNFF